MKILSLGGGASFLPTCNLQANLAGLAMMPGRTMTLEQGRQ